MLLIGRRDALWSYGIEIHRKDNASLDFLISGGTAVFDILSEPIVCPRQEGGLNRIQGKVDPRCIAAPGGCGIGHRVNFVEISRDRASPARFRNAQFRDLAVGNEETKTLGDFSDG